MADVAVPSIATATPVAADSVLGVVASSGAVKRFAASPPFSQLAATTGANLIGYDAGEVYDAGTVGEAIQAGTGGGANLSYTASPTNGVVASDTGTDATVPLADGTNAGLMTPAQFTKLSNTSGTNTGDQTATTVANTPAGNIAATTVQAAINELDTEKQATLVSATNIKTINGSTLLGSGDLSISGSGLGDVSGPASAVSGNVAIFDGTSGKLLKDTGVTVSGTNTGDVANTAVTTGTLAQFAATTSLQLKGVISDETGSGALVFATSPALVTPDLGTPSAAVLTSATGLPVATGISGLGTGVATALAVNVGTAGAAVVNGGALGTPASGALTNCTFPTLNQNTSGSAATLTTTRAIYGNNFDGSAALTQIIASGFGGTGNGFAKFSGPATAEKTFTLPDASATILTSNAAVTVAQGGTGLATLTTGNVILGAGTSTPTFVAPGTSGNVLTSNGSTWTSAAAAGGGAWTLLSTVTASGVATADVDTTFSSTYDHYFIIVDGIAVSVDGDAIWARLKLSGTYATADYKYHLNKSGDGASTYSGLASSSAAQIVVCNNVGSNAVWSANLTMQVLKPAGTAFRKSVHWAGVVPGTASGNMETASGAGMHNNSTSAITGVRFMASTGNITGVFRLYGVTN